MSEEDKSRVTESKVININHENSRGYKRKLSDKSYVRRKKFIHNSPEKNCSSAETVEEVLEDMEDEIDLALEHRENKSELTTTGVKNILRHIIANEYVLNMVQNTMQNSDGELEDNYYGPKLTRSKAKEMRNKQFSLPWPVSTPAKIIPNDSQKLLQEEYPEECSSDEDYRPNEEEIRSDDDDEELSPKRSSVPKRTPSPVSRPSESHSDDESPLVIELPEDVPQDSSEADKIALRTRSKLPLNDTPLEAIEASFIDPDITLDMYETLVDDEEWLEFCAELSRPIDTVLVKETEVDDGDDLDYKVVEDDIPDYNDLRYDSSVKITRDELNALIAEILEYAQDLTNLEDEEESRTLNDSQTSICNEPLVQWMSEEERRQLDEQMRMYVQLLTQSYLLSHGSSKLNFINVSAKIFLDEIKMFACRELPTDSKSAFYAHNLDGALEIVDKYENLKKATNFKRYNFKVVPHHIRQTMAESKVFIYPELLPLNGFREVFVKGKSKFTPPEDNLIALGLEQFQEFKNPIECIQSLLVPCKTVDQIRIRIKNAKHKLDATSNPIKYYHEFKEAPEFHRVVRIFNPNSIKAPADYPSEILPRWMHSFCHMEGYIPIAPKAESPVAPPPISSPPPPPSEPRRLPPLLPRLSPFRHISPILKKYSQQRSSPVKRLRPKPTPATASRPVSPGSISTPSPKSNISQISLGKSLTTSEEEKSRAASDEEETVATETTAVTTVPSQKKPAVSKKRNRLQRDIEASLSLLQPGLLENDPKREERETLFANSYLSRATEILKGDPEVREKFLATLCKYHNSSQSPVKLYSELKEVLKNYPLLVRDFAVFLRPEQALECGAFQEYTLLTKVREFFRKVEIHFRDQPQHIGRIVRAFSQLNQQVDITSGDVLSTLRPLLRNQSHLLEELQSLFLDATPPQYLLTDFEEVRLPNSEEENSGSSSCEELEIPEEPDPVGGKDCPCPCHPSDTKMLRHCNKCGVKFIDGRIYIQTGKVLKPAQVTYHVPPPENNCAEKLATPQIKGQAEVTKAAPSETTNGNKTEVQLEERNPQLPCEVEDTVLPGSAAGPSDFSDLRQMIASSEPDSAAKPQSTEWTKDEDTLIIYNCQRYGITRKAFACSAEALKTRSADEVKERFLKLMECISEELKKDSIALEKES